MTTERPRIISDLEEGHLQRLIRVTSPGEGPDWALVEERIKTHAQEALTWVHGKSGWDDLDSSDDECEFKERMMNYVHNEPEFRMCFDTRYEKLDTSRNFLHTLCGLECVDLDSNSNKGHRYTRIAIPKITPQVVDNIVDKVIRLNGKILTTVDGHDQIPLHVFLNTASWNSCTEKMFNMLVGDDPTTFRMLARSRRSALHFSLQQEMNKVSMDKGGTDVRKKIVLRLLESFPEACCMQDQTGYLPLHLAAKNFPCKDVIDKIYSYNPNAVVVRSSCDNMTPIQLLFSKYGDSARFKRRILSWDVLPKIFPTHCFDDPGHWPHNSNPKAKAEGDLLDSLCNRLVDTADDYGSDLISKKCNLQLIPKVMSEVIELRGWNQNGNLLVHSLLNGKACRRFHHEALRILLFQFPEAAKTKDEDGNLPLHVILRSCADQTTRTIKSGLVSNVDAYLFDLKTCIRNLLRSNPEAVTTKNKEGDTPLHLAFKHDLVLSGLIETEQLFGTYKDPRWAMRIKDGNGNLPHHLLAMSVGSATGKPGPFSREWGSSIRSNHDWQSAFSNILQSLKEGYNEGFKVTNNEKKLPSDIARKICNESLDVFNKTLVSPFENAAL